MPKVSSAHVEARTNQILDAATACFAEHGVRGTTIQRICEAAGLSPGAVYRYFDSKEAIFEAVYSRSIAQNRAFGSQIAQAPDPREALHALVGAMVGFIADPALQREHHLSLQVHAEGLSDPAIAKGYVRLHKDIVAQIAPLIRGLQEQGRVTAELDAEYFTWVLVATYQGLRVHKMLDPELDLERFSRTLQQVVDKALTP